MKRLPQLIAILLLCAAHQHADADAVRIDVAPDKDYTHAASGISLPATIPINNETSFRREHANRFDEKALNVSGSYYCEQPAVATIYIYPLAANRTLDDAFARVIDDIREVYVDINMETEKESITAPSSIAAMPLQGLHARMTLKHPDVAEPRGSDVYLFQAGNWLIKLRISYPTESKADVTPFFEKLAAAITRTYRPK